MLHLIHSNRLEALAQAYAQTLQAKPLNDPFVQETVVVQNAGMGRWLSLQLARQNGIAANMRYLFPAELTWELLRAVLTDVPERDPCSPRLLRWRLLQEFQQGALGYRKTLDHYLKTGQDESAWQLAQQVARVFDGYLFFRPDWIKAWESADTETSKDWQEQLWRHVVGEQHLQHWIRLQNRFMAELQRSPVSDLPARICFFSVPALSPAYIELIAHVAQRTEVYFFVMNPSHLYWGDIESQRRKIRYDLDEQAYITVGNPLLASWGRQGRDFIEILRNTEPYPDEEEFFIELDRDTVLHAVQADILNLEGDVESALDRLSPPQGQAAWQVDGSIVLHSCHSPMREVEVLYDQLLAALETYKGLTPAEIVVMSPDIDRYAPFIEAVFGAGRVRLPFSIADQRFSQALTISAACVQLLELPQQRFEAESVFALLEYAEIRQQFGLDEIQVQQCREWVRAVNIRWGVDAEFRQQFSQQTTFEHTWMYGLDRLLLGFAMPGQSLLSGILPYNDLEGTQAQILERFQQCLYVLFTMAQWSSQRATLSQWRELFSGVLEQLFPEEAETYLIYQSMDALLEESRQADFQGVVSWAIFRDALRRQLEQQHQNEGFLGQGITFCTLMPMRSVPFRVVALLGMQDGGFPRQDQRLSFDKMAYDKARKGDRSKRDEDRYLFLESVLSARERLYISYIGQSIQDNSPSMPSVLVAELLDYLEKRFGLTSQALTTMHPLQAFSQRYFTQPDLFTYARDYVELHTEVQRQIQPLAFWDGKPLPEPDAALKQLSLTELIRFYRHPARRFLQQLDVAVREEVDELVEREPFKLEAFADTYIGQQTLLHLEQGGDADSLQALLRAQGILPHGRPGELLFEQHFQAAEQLFQQLPKPAETQHVDMRWQWGDVALHATLTAVSAEGLQLCHFGYLGAWQWIGIWLNHLALNACPDLPAHWKRQTRVYTEQARYQLSEIVNPLEVLERLLDGYWQGLREPLPFFPKSSWAWVEAKNETQREKEALVIWEGTDYKSGEGEQPEYQLLYRGRQPIVEQSKEVDYWAHLVFGELKAVCQIEVI